MQRLLEIVARAADRADIFDQTAETVEASSPNQSAQTT